MDLPRADLDEPPTLPLLSMMRHTNTAQLTKLGHQSGLANAPAEKRHWPSYLLGNLDDGKSEKVFLPLMVCARLLLVFGVRVAYL